MYAYRRLRRDGLNDLANFSLCLAQMDAYVPVRFTWQKFLSPLSFGLVPSSLTPVKTLGKTNKQKKEISKMLRQSGQLV